MTKRRILLTLFSAPIIFWAFSALVVLAASEIGGCQIHEGYANTCTLVGYDFGEFLYSLGIFAAWGLLLIPILWGYMIVGWGAYEAVAFAFRRFRNK